MGNWATPKALRAWALRGPNTWASSSLQPFVTKCCSVKVGVGRGGKDREETLEIRSLNNAMLVRGRKGKAADLGFKPNAVRRVL